MTIAELIAELERHDESLPVVVHGWENGFAGIGSPKEVRLVPVNKSALEWWVGEFDRIEETKTGGFLALCIN
jgi:hypothetical protein